MEVSGKLHSDDLCKMCEACQVEGLSTNADGFCVDCNDYMCQTCFRHHLKYKTSRNHVLGPLTLGKKETREDRPTTEQCKKHSKEVLKYYCRKHDAVACGDCTVADHNGCDMQFIKHLSKKFHETTEFKDLMRKIQCLEDKNEKCEKQMELNCAESRSLAEKALAEIRKFRREINDHLDRTEAEIVSDVNRLSKGNEELMSEIQEKIAEINHNLAELKPKLDISLYKEDVLFINFVGCKPKYSYIEQSVEEINKRNHIASFTFEPDQKIKELLTPRWKLGTLKVVTIVEEETRKKQDKSFTQQHQNIANTQTKLTQNIMTETAEGLASIHSQRCFPPDPRAAGFDVGKRVWRRFSALFGGGGVITAVDPSGYVDVSWKSGHKSRERAGVEGRYAVELIE